MSETPEPKIVRLSGDDVKVGVALPWSTYDNGGRLLLRAGAIITSLNQLSILLERGMYRQKTAQDDVVTPAPAVVVEEQPLNPFLVIGEIVNRTRVILRAIADEKAEGAQERILKLCTDIQTVCNLDADAALGAMHLDREEPYAITHALYCALLSDLIMNRMGLEEKTRGRVMAAGLTANVGMLDLQEQLLKHQGPLSDDTWAEIKRHPQRSVELLRAAGVGDEQWLAIVDQHHEKADGSGYSRGLTGAAIKKEARLISVVDRYHAMISDRETRSGMAPTAALRKVFSQKDECLDEDVIRLLIKEIGVYPPGVHVRLANGEIALVTRRGKDGTSPRVTSVISPRGAPYNKPFVRDCSLAEYAIKEMIEPAITVPVSNLHGLWGYGYVMK